MLPSAGAASDTAVAVGTVAVRDVRAVLPDRVLDGAVVVCEDGVITEVRAGGPAPAGAVDGRGALLLPGIVDVHSDALEVDVNPRPGTAFPIDFALGAFEGRVRAAGVTTVFHGVGFYEYGGRGAGRDGAAAGLIVCPVAGRGGDGSRADDQLRRAKARANRSTSAARALGVRMSTGPQRTTSTPWASRSQSSRRFSA